MFCSRHDECWICRCFPAAYGRAESKDHGGWQWRLRPSGFLIHARGSRCYMHQPTPLFWMFLRHTFLHSMLMDHAVCTCQTLVWLGHWSNSKAVCSSERDLPEWIQANDRRGVALAMREQLAFGESSIRWFGFWHWSSAAHGQGHCPWVLTGKINF